MMAMVAAIVVWESSLPADRHAIKGFKVCSAKTERYLRILSSLTTQKRVEYRMRYLVSVGLTSSHRSDEPLAARRYLCI